MLPGFLQTVTQYSCTSALKDPHLDKYHKQNNKTKNWPLRSGGEIKIHQKIPVYFKNNLLVTSDASDVAKAPPTCLSYNVSLKFCPTGFVHYENFLFSPFSFVYSVNVHFQ